MHPSLYALFCRSKYAKGLEFHAGEDERTIQRRHLQTERFAVAAIALCLKHDREFFGHFLRIVCGLNELDTPFDILVEDKRWGDLVLVAYDQSKVFVIECKIQASLENHQNPTHHSDEFWLNGYGKEITDRYSTQNTYIEYVVLGYGPKLEGLPYVRSNLKCSQVFWDDLKGGFPKTNLCSDLEMTLAALHVSAFRSGRTDRMKKSNDARIAAETFGLLNDVLDEVGFIGTLTAADISFDDGENWQFGLALKTKKSPEGKLKDLHEVVKPEHNQVGWLGYTNGTKGGETQPSVWFYCQRSQFKVLRRRLSKAGFSESKISTGEDEKWHHLSVSATVEDVDAKGGDKEWFKSVLLAVL